MWLKWLPWKFVTRRLAHSHGFLDPIGILAYLRRFAEPSEVTEPIELLRAGMVFHARGLINSRAIQHNLDWVWPYWVERQFDPKDPAFIPRAFSITHINLTHRNWTAVGVPDCSELPIVDPRGLVTPLLDRWSIDGWILTEDGVLHAPSKSAECVQTFKMENNVSVVTETPFEMGTLRSEVSVEAGAQGTECRIRFEGIAAENASLIVTLRPFNPEGVSFIHKVALSDDHQSWHIEDSPAVFFSDKVDAYAMSNYRDGDVGLEISRPNSKTSEICDVGMATAAMVYKLKPSQKRTITVNIPLDTAMGASSEQRWQKALAGTCTLKVPDQQIQYLYDTALRSLILHSPDDAFPGPYTYKRFWFRDAAFIVNSCLLMGLIDRAETILDRFPSRQNTHGFFHSQDGEWDSNGEALWIMHRYCALSGRRPKDEWISSIQKGAHWIRSKRIRAGGTDANQGLLPAGFSAEHLGPNDFYYWDDFWGVAGLQAAAAMLNEIGDDKGAVGALLEAEDFMKSIEDSLANASARLNRSAMPASPSRRLDTGAIGSLAAGYPLQLFESNDPRLLDTADFLYDTSIIDGGFFHDMVHSGINPYLTLHLAQVYLRAGDPRFQPLMKTVAELATSTGQWPEAIHPATKGGCMGDGQHAWASAEWLSMVRNCFVMEDLSANKLIVGAGIHPSWLESENGLFFGPTPTIWGTVSVSIETMQDHLEVICDGDWFSSAPPIEIRISGFPCTEIDGGTCRIELERELIS
jgi:hypothetical protein